MSQPNNLHNEQVTKAVQSTFASIVRTRQTLKILAPEFRWTIGGNLVGDFGEYIAITEYSLLPAPKGSKDFDARTQDGKTVQIKANHEAGMIGYRGASGFNVGHSNTRRWRLERTLLWGLSAR